MTAPTPLADPDPNKIESEHFILRRYQDAFGESWAFASLHHLGVRLIQPFNDWCQKHFDKNYSQRNQENLLALLEIAYQRGRQDMRSEIRDLLGCTR